MLKTKTAEIFVEHKTINVRTTRCPQREVFSPLIYLFTFTAQHVKEFIHYYTPIVVDELPYMLSSKGE